MGTQKRVNMIYLVITDRGGQTFPRSPEDLELLFDQLVDTLEILSKLKAKGKILAGGMPSGQRKHTFIIEAESNNEVTELVQRLPLWIEHKWEIIPLETWDHHLDFINQYREELGLKYLIDRD